jgi:uncharacterized membrane protein
MLRSQNLRRTKGALMPLSRIIGIVMLVIGVVLLIFGFQATDTVGEDLHEAVTGRYTDTTMWYLIGGGALGLLGLLLTIFAPKTPRG